MYIKKVPPQWQRLGFASEEDMNEHEEIYKRRKAQIDYMKAEKENENGRN